MNLLFRRLPLPPTQAFLLTLAVVYAFTGLIGHDPWKTDDAIGTGIVSQMLRQGQWWLPNLAGEIFLEDGPLYYWLAAALAWATSPLLELHDGARLASGVMLVLTMLLLRQAAAELHGKAEGDGAALALLGSLGLLVHAHENLAEMGMLAAQALSLYAVVMGRHRALMAGLLLGAGWACAFLAKGTGAAVIPLLTAVALPAVNSAWRTRRYAGALALAATLALVLIGAWLLAAMAHSGPALQAWLAFQVGYFNAPGLSTIADYGVTLCWVAWPAWPIAAWILWVRRRQWDEAGMALPLTALLIAAGVVVATPGTREINALALLLPVSLVAGAGIPVLRRGAASALAWFGLMTFTFFGGLIWLGWFAMMTGVPEQIQRNFAKLEPGHVPQFQSPMFVLALAFSLGWLFLLLRSERSVFRGVTYWAAGLALVWCLIMTLWLDWIDYGRTYRPVALALKKALPGGTRCIESRNLGEAQRAAFDYHAGITTRRAEVDGRKGCGLLLVQAHANDEDRSLGQGWKRIWEGNRPRDRERYRLYIRQP